MSSSKTTFALSFGSRVGLVIVVEAALLSVLAVASLLLYVVFNAFRNKYRPPTRRGVQPWHFLRSPVDYYFLSLLVSDLIQASAAALSIRWVNSGHIDASTFCVTQGVMKQLGDVGVALATLVIGFHTFFVLCFRWRAPESKWLPLSVIAAIWIFLVAIIAIPGSIYNDPPYFGPNPPWCWIDSRYRKYQYGLEYGILWATAIINLILYGILFFCLRGNLNVSFGESEGVKRRFPRFRWETVKSQNAWQRDAEQRKEQMVIARQMLGYPIAYIIMILPLSITRPLQFTYGSHTVPSAAATLSGVMFGLSGLINVLLYVVTRPAVLRSVRMCIAGPSRRGVAAPGRTTAGRTNNNNGGMTMPEVTVDESEAGGEYDDHAYDYEGGGVTVMSERSNNAPQLGVQSYMENGRLGQTLDVPGYPPSSHPRTPSDTKDGGSWSPSELSAGHESWRGAR